MNRFIVLGTNFTKADTETRSRFAITPIQLDSVFQKAKSKYLIDFFVLSTCNRTEFYACASREIVQMILMEHLNLDLLSIEKYFYFLEGTDAIRHLFRVAVGLDSQIIGDYEIVGQLKQAVRQARENDLIGTRTDRITSFAFQTSKEIKSTTNLSNGKYSVSYSATELISEKFPNKNDLRILVVGLGKIGGTLSKNLREYFPKASLTMCNRTIKSSERLASELNGEVLPFQHFNQHLHAFDVVITAAQADYFLIKTEDVKNLSSTLLIDLSIPQVIDPAIKSTGIDFYTVDDVSAFHNNLLKQRFDDIPKAEKIIENKIIDLSQWLNVFFTRDIIHTYKDRMTHYLAADENHTKRIDKSFSKLIQQIRSEGYRGCSVIETVNELIATA